MNSEKENLYEKNVKGRTLYRFCIGLFPRVYKYIQYSYARKVARNRGATIGDNVVMPLSLARKANANLYVGNNSVINTTNFSSFRYKIIIGNNVIIGERVKIVLGSHNIASENWEHYRSTDQLVIEDYVWLCPDSVILPSCNKIGYGCVVGANSVVVHDAEDMSVISGNPAKLIKVRPVVHSSLVVESVMGGDLKRYVRTWMDR